MSIGAALLVGTEAVSLADEIVKFVKETRAAGHEPTLNELRLRLPMLAANNMNRILARISALRRELIGRELIDKTIGEVAKSESSFDWIFYTTVSEYRKEMEGIRLALQGALDDSSSVLLCMGLNDRSDLGAAARAALQSVSADTLSRKKELGAIVTLDKKMS